jgi:hypothetical protein
MAKRFRKAFIICEDNGIFGKMTQVTLYKYRDHAEFACKTLQAKAKDKHQKLWNANQPIPVYKVHGFYLVHEDMFRD